MFVFGGYARRVNDLDAPVGPSVSALDLDPAQEAAVRLDSRALLIVAGAGTGKTRTLVARVARLIESGVPPSRLLLVTFSRRAADEMIRRLSAVVGADLARQVPAGTFHSVAHRLLQRHRDVLGLGGGFTIIDHGDAADLIHLGRRTVQLDDRAGRFPRKETLLAVYSRVVNSQRPLRQVLRSNFPWTQEHEAALAEIFVWYTDRKRRSGLLDFDDLLLYWQAAATDATVGRALAAAYDHVLIDEYQDTNGLQTDIIRSLWSAGCSVTAVGDDAQAIYGFRSAARDTMLSFPETFPGAEVVKLERSYRSTQPVLDLANAVLEQANEGYAKRLWTRTTGGGRPVLAVCPDEASEAEAVADVILELCDNEVALREQAVLFRASHHSDPLEVELRRRRIPFVKYGGLRFLEASHLRDLLASLRLLDNPRDELAWFRLLQLLEGVGGATARRVMVALGVTVEPWQQTGPPGETHDPVAALTGDPPGLPARARADAAGLARALLDCRDGFLSPGAQIDRLRDGLEPLLRRRYENAEIRLRDFDALAQLAAGYRSRAGMTADLILDPPASSGDLAGDPLLDDDFLTLSTVHSAKGREWRSVHIIHAADGMFPSDLATGSAEEIEEERRLFYVAVTRAKERLHIYVPLRMHHGGPFGRSDTHSYTQRTRFLPTSVDGLLDRRPVRTRPDEVNLAGISAELPGAVERSLRNLW
jgi:DNA helicase II / ATP-dependent DNA helicase PcrA